MRDLNFEEAKKQLPKDKHVAKKANEDTKQVRVSKEAYDILKKQAFMTDTTMKDYLDNLIINGGK